MKRRVGELLNWGPFASLWSSLVSAGPGDCNPASYAVAVTAACVFAAAFFYVLARNISLSRQLRAEEDTTEGHTAEEDVAGEASTTEGTAASATPATPSSLEAATDRGEQEAPAAKVVEAFQQAEQKWAQQRKQLEEELGATKARETNLQAMIQEMEAKELRNRETASSLQKQLQDAYERERERLSTPSPAVSSDAELDEARSTARKSEETLRILEGQREMLQEELRRTQKALEETGTNLEKSNEQQKQLEVELKQTQEAAREATQAHKAAEERAAQHERAAKLAEETCRSLERRSSPQPTERLGALRLVELQESEQKALAEAADARTELAKAKAGFEADHNRLQAALQNLHDELNRSASEHEQHTAQLRARENELRAELVNVSGLVTDLRRSEQTVQDALLASEQDRSHLCELRFKREAEVQRLQNENDSLQRRIRELQNSVDRGAEEELRRQLRTAQDYCDQLSADLEQLRARLAQGNQREMELQRNEASTLIVTLSEQLHEAQGKIIAQEHQLEEQTLRYKQRVGTLQQRLQEEERANGQLRAEIQEQREETAQLLEALKEREVTLQTERDTALKSAAESKARLRQQPGTATNAPSRGEQLLLEETARLESELRHTSDLLHSVVAERDMLRHEMAVLKGDLRQATTELDALQQRHKQMTKLVADSAGDAANVRERLQRTEEELRRIKNGTPRQAEGIDRVNQSLNASLDETHGILRELQLQLTRTRDPDVDDVDALHSLNSSPRVQSQYQQLLESKVAALYRELESKKQMLAEQEDRNALLSQLLKKFQDVTEKQDRIIRTVSPPRGAPTPTSAVVSPPGRGGGVPRQDRFLQSPSRNLN